MKRNTALTIGHHFWQMKAISYIWANKLIKGESVPNVYTANARMVVVKSGDGKAGQRLIELAVSMKICRFWKINALPEKYDLK